MSTPAKWMLTSFTKDQVLSLFPVQDTVLDHCMIWGWIENKESTLQQIDNVNSWALNLAAHWNHWGTLNEH